MFPSPPQHTFHDRLTWRIVTGLLLCSLLAWGIYDRADSGKFDPLILVSVILAGVLFSFALIWAMRRRITIHQEGISYVSLFRDADLLWDEITATRYQQQSVEAGRGSDLTYLLFLLVADRVNYTLPSLWVCGQQTIRISTCVCKGDEAIGLVLGKVDARLRPEAERLLSAGASVSFGKITLSPEGLIWKGKPPIPWNSIGDCQLDGRRLRIHKEGRRYGMTILSKKVPNVFVLMEIIKSRKSAAVLAAQGESRTEQPL
jgi:hypothetical protein